MAAKYASRADPQLPSCSAACSKLLFRLSVAELLAAAAAALEECAQANDERVHQDISSRKTRFHAKIPPAIGVEAYLKRLLQLTPFPLDALILSLVYINRITHLAGGDQLPLFPACRQQPTSTSFKLKRQGEEDPAPSLNSHTVHRLLLGALTVAASYTSDHFIARVRAVKVGGTSFDELQDLEVEVFKKLGFNCVVRSRELEDVSRELWERTPAGKAELEEVKKATRFDLSDEEDDEELETRTQYCYTPKHQMHHTGGLASSPRAPQRVSFAVPEDEGLSATPPLSEGESDSSYFSSSFEDGLDVDLAGHIASTSAGMGKDSRNSTPRLIRGMNALSH